MTESVSPDIEKLVFDKIEKGVIGSSLCLENRKLGDEGITKLSNLEILSEIVCSRSGSKVSNVSPCLEPVSYTHLTLPTILLV